MNILVTLPRELITKIITREKRYEMRKSFPERMDVCAEGFFVVEKGTDEIKCWCRVDEVLYTYIDDYTISKLPSMVCVPEEYIRQYGRGKMVYLWRIGKVITFENLKRSSLKIYRNPQQFVYCPGSYGEPHE